MSNKEICASCLNFGINEVVKSVEKRKPTWLKNVDYVRDFINKNTSFSNRVPTTYDNTLKLDLGKKHAGKKVLYWGTNSTSTYLTIHDAKKAYGRFENSGIQKVNQNGIVTIKIECPQIYRVQKTGRHKPSSYFKHFHFVLSNTNQTSWEPQIYTKLIICHYDYNKMMELHMKKHCVLINTLPNQYYLEQHIPGSHNIYHEDIRRLSQKQLFKRIEDIIRENYPRIHNAIKNKKIEIHEIPIVLYCAHSKCNSSRIGAEEFLKKGFVNISEYKGGMKEYISLRNK